MADEDATGSLMRGGFSLFTIFGAPIVLAALSLIGLLGALLADGLWDWIGAGLLAVSVLAVVWARFRRQHVPAYPRPR